jgi:hypothetical protein
MRWYIRKKSGFLRNGIREFKYTTSDDQQFSKQRPQRSAKVSSFSNIATSDTYLAVGSAGCIQIFIIEGKFAGRWVYSDDIDDAVINKLAFSSDGRYLVALLVYGNNKIEEARIYATEKFPSGDLERSEVVGSTVYNPVSVKWERDFIHHPNALVFSANGQMIAFCTSHSAGKAQIRMLKRDVATWRLWGVEEISIYGIDPHDRTGGGFTGISLYVHCIRANSVSKMMSVWLFR